MQDISDRPVNGTGGAVGAGIAFTVSGTVFHDLVTGAAVCASTDKFRLHLTGVLLVVSEPELKVVSTDSYVLAVGSASVDSSEPVSVGEILLPAKDLVTVAKVFAKARTVSVSVDDSGRVWVRSREAEYSISPLDAKFPPGWANVFPSVTDPVPPAVSEWSADNLARLAKIGGKGSVWRRESYVARRPELWTVVRPQHLRSASSVDWRVLIMPKIVTD